jgi:hypothetical protein
MATPNTSDHFEERFPVSICWQCGADMEYCANHIAWECTCGFTLNEGFCQITHASFECIVFHKGMGLAKHRGVRRWRVVGLQHRWD